MPNRQREEQLLRAGIDAGITSSTELANFMAQITVESQGLTRLEEGFRYTQGVNQIPVASAWRKGDEALNAAWAKALHGDPADLADLMYGDRMGNNTAGDGHTYRGRGYIQITGKENYSNAGKALGIDLVENPDLASVPHHAERIATWFWNREVKEHARENVLAATKYVNGGDNHLPERVASFKQWQDRLTPEVMADLIANRSPNATIRPPASELTHDAPHRTLRENHRGPEVRQLQRRLDALGYSGKDGPLIPDGHFGANTRHAVETLQQDHGLTMDGIAGKQTLNALYAQADRAPQLQWRLDQPEHPDHSLYLQAQQHIHQLDARFGRAPDHRSNNLAAALTTAARSDGLERIDQIALSDDRKTLWATERAPGARDRFWDKVTNVEVVKSINTSIEQSSEQWSLAAEASHQQNEVQTQRHIQVDIESPAIHKSGPTLRH